MAGEEEVLVIISSTYETWPARPRYQGFEITVNYIFYKIVSR